MTDPVLEVRRLRVAIRRHRAVVAPVDDVSFTVDPGEALGLVGESGAGKSLTLRALVGLLPEHGRVVGGELLYRPAGGDLGPYRPENVRGRGMAMVFQEPMTALNPLLRVGSLLAEALRGRGGGRASCHRRAIGLLHEVGVPDPERQLRTYAHQLSGGLRQRVMIAMALATEPRVLLCDEPTTALDVTVQDQVLRLIDRLREKRNLAVVFVTHDLAVIAEVCDRVAVLYAGRIVETGPVSAVFGTPRHPYTDGLVRAQPQFDRPASVLSGIGGTPPEPGAFPTGCRFHPRCALAREDCAAAEHELFRVGAGDGHSTACIHADDLLAPTCSGAIG